MTNFASKLPITLHELYGDRVVFTSRPSFGKNPWLTTEFHQANMLTARELLIADMPVILHEATVGERTIQLFNAVQIELSGEFRTFKDADDYSARLKEVEANGEKLYYQYVHGPEYVNPAVSYIDRNLFVGLNNKMRLSEWTQNKYMPRRDIVHGSELSAAVKSWQYPYVIKPGDDHPTAGGYGVMICFNDNDLKQALQRIEAAEVDSDFVIEDYITAKANYCVQYAYSDTVGMKYLGASIQLTNEYGKYQGNITAAHVPEAVIEAGREIMQNGVDAGYRGIAGFDLLVDEHNDIYAIDLNFRQNGSTAMLLTNDVLSGKFKKFLGYYSKIDNETFFKRILEEVAGGRLFPLAFYDGDFYEKNGYPSRFVGIWHGEEADVEVRDAAFTMFNQGDQFEK